MHRHARHVAFAALLFTATCSKNNNNVGTIKHDSGAGGQTSQTGGATTASGGAGGHTSVSTGGTTVLGGNSGSGGGNSAAGCLYQGVTYALGEGFKDDCNTCMCGRFGDAVVSCTAMACGDGSVGPSGSIDAPLDGPIDTQPVDSDGCPAPNVWRYEQPGCDGQVQPVCGPAGGDACATAACGCDGESLVGCDYYSKPYRSRGDLCPGACFSPTHNLEIVNYGSGFIKGCACDATTDPPQCVSRSATYALNFTCVGGVWNATSLASCETCPTGTVRATPLPPAGQFTPFCAQPCATTLDCPSGGHCVDLIGASPNPGPVCVSATNPPPVANPQSDWHWDMTVSCRPSNILEVRYNDPNSQVAGHELVLCPTSCVSSVPDGGISGIPYAHCE